MKKTVILLVLSQLLFAGCTTRQADWISRIEKANRSHNSIHFKVMEKYSYSYAPDTTATPYEVWVVRDKKDSLHHGYVWVDNAYRPYHEIYDRGNFYLAIPPKKTTILYPHFTGDFISPVDWIGIFLNPGKLKKLTTQPGAVTTITDTLFHQHKAIKISVDFKEGTQKYTFVLDPVKMVPLWSEMIRKQPQYTYRETLDFSGFSFDKVQPDRLRQKQKKVLEQNPVKENGWGSETARLEKMLHKGDVAPLFSGTYYGSGKPFALKDAIGKKVILLDFWYTHCPPCVRAMPALSKLFLRYQSKGLVVFGLNSVDNRPQGLRYLKTFLGKRAISYPVILTQPEVDLRYKINGYPSMYIIDKAGKIAFVDIGFNQVKLKKLTEEVEKLLK